MNKIMDTAIQVDENDPRWLTVPQRVADLYIKYAGVAYDLQAADPTAPYWELYTEECGPLLIKNAANDPSIWSQIGTAADKIPPATHSALQQTEKWLGGPSPLAAMLLSGALGAGLGYGGGYMLHKLMPRWFKREAARRFALLGGLGAGAIPLAFHGIPNMAELGIKGLFYPTRFQGRTTDVAPDGTYGVREDVVKPLGNKSYTTPVKTAAVNTGLAELIRQFEQRTGAKAASFMPANMPSNLAGSGDLRPINVNEWGQAVNSDPKLTGTQKAIFGGVPYIAGVVRNSRWVRPSDVAYVAANAGLGGLIGAGIAAVAGPFLALTPEAQRGIQNAGILAGALKSMTGIGV